ncbi:hypothetical protein DL767_002827 [Monosporascus sp. MG133]|nr:hypothetical protein DL767_002827 [Monosporascus sp. MG133]
MPSNSNIPNGTPNTSTGTSSTGTKDWKPYTVPYTGGGAIPTDRGWVPSAWVVDPGAARAPNGLAFPAAAGSANAVVPGRDPESQTKLHEPVGVFSVFPAAAEYARERGGQGQRKGEAKGDGDEDGKGGEEELFWSGTRTGWRA